MDFFENYHNPYHMGFRLRLRRRREAERRAALEKKRDEGLAALLEVQARQAELTGLLADLDGWTGAEVLPPRLARLRRWLDARRDGLVAATSTDGIEAWLIKYNLFGDDEDQAAPEPPGAMSRACVGRVPGQTRQGRLRPRSVP